MDKDISERPAPLTPFERIVWQQQNCRSDVVGYAVGLASERTKRVAYLTLDGDLTNDEREAAILSKEKATKLMTGLYDSGDWYRKRCWKIALLVPVSETHPLTMCTFQGH